MRIKFNVDEHASLKETSYSYQRTIHDRKTGEDKVLPEERERWTVHLEFSHPPPKRRRKREREVLESQLTTNRISMNSTDIFLFNLSLNLREFDM